MTLHGNDVSHYQPDWRPSTGDSFAIVKATEGTTYTSPTHASQVALARAAGMVVGHYHYGHPGNIAAQVSYFLSVANPQAGDVLAFDWEGGTPPSCADKDAFLKGCKTARPHNRAIVYANQDFWLNRNPSKYAADGLWLATIGHSSPPTVGTPVLFWQYTDTPLDQDYAYFGSKAELVAWASYTPKPAPKPTPSPTPVAPAFPLPAGSYFGPRSGPKESVSGYYSHSADLATWQKQMAHRGWHVTVTGHFDGDTPGVVHAFQLEKFRTADDELGPNTWKAAWNAPVTK